MLFFKLKIIAGKSFMSFFIIGGFFRFISRVDNGVSFNKERAEKFFFYNVARNATMGLILSHLISLIQSKIHVTNNGKMGGQG